MKRTTFIALSITLVLSACDYFKGPEGPQGEPGPAYPLHLQKSISGVVFQDDSQPEYTGVNFDTQSTWFLSSLDADSLYDIIVAASYTQLGQVSISAGNNAYTELYLIESVDSFDDITTLPQPSQKRNLILFDVDDKPIFFMAKNRYSRWAKVRVSQQSWEYNTYNSVNYYSYWLLLEGYYYKDQEPDLTLHKRL